MALGAGAGPSGWLSPSKPSDSSVVGADIVDTALLQIGHSCLDFFSQTSMHSSWKTWPQTRATKRSPFSKLVWQIAQKSLSAPTTEESDGFGGDSHSDGPAPAPRAILIN